jgi:hypothetical protein
VPGDHVHLLLALCVGLAHLAPFFVLLVPLALGRYPGERRLVAAAARARSLPRPARSTQAPRRALRVAVARGGDLIARALATRPPPGLALSR